MQTTPPSPFAPFYRLAPNRVWRTYLGGRTLEQIGGAAAPADSHFPEDWLLSTTPARNVGREEFADEGISRVETADGVRLLPDLVADAPEAFFGAAHFAKYGAKPGFLLKYLDAAIRLHMQCHPSIPFAKAHLNSNFGKTEGYYILGVRPGCEGYVYLGFQRAPSREEFRRAVVEQDSAAILSGFDKMPVRPGDCFHVPGGIPHAIGEGVFMIEMMEPTDFAVRVEFERGGYVLPEAARFMGRDVDFAISMFDFTSRDLAATRRAFFVEPAPLPVEGDATRESLFDERKTACFRAERLRVDGSASVAHDGLRVFVVTEGEGRLRAGSGAALDVRRFDRILIPASTASVRIDGALEIFCARPPK